MAEPRGVTLLVAVILASVILSVSLALLDITYKQILLASSAKQSQYAFYNADSAMECALYWDQQKDAFDYTETGAGGIDYMTSGISCSDQGVSQTIIGVNPPNSSTAASGVRTVIFYLPCNGSATNYKGMVTVTKSSTGTTNIFATGYSSCNPSDPRRIERGLKVNY